MSNSYKNRSKLVKCQIQAINEMKITRELNVVINTMPEDIETCVIVNNTSHEISLKIINFKHR